MVAATLTTYGELDVAYLRRSAYVVTVTVGPPAPPVVPPPVEANPSAVFDQVRRPPPVVGVVGAEVAPLTKLKDHCIRAMSEQVSSTIGLLPAVEPSLSLTHSPIATLFTRYLPEAPGGRQLRRA